MILTKNTLIKFLKNKSKIAYCEIKNNLGSSPREKGAWMLISHKGEIFGTIGGGQLEFNLINNVISQNWNNDSNSILKLLWVQISHNVVEEKLLFQFKN